MLPVRRLLPVLISVSLLLLARLHAAPLGRGESSHVQASLVAAVTAVQPGKDIIVALRLVHEEPWHTYWLNPGTGLPTSLSWKLPPGWRAGEIQWPAPNVIRDRSGSIVGQGFDGDLLLPVILTAPADLAAGSQVTLSASAEWLMCSDTCIPGDADVSLTLPVTAGEPTPNPEWSSKIEAVLAGLPRPSTAWQTSATRSGNTVTLRVEPRERTVHKPDRPWFFPADATIAFDQPQRVEPQGNGGYVITLAASPDAPASRLVGVLTSENGWGGSEKRRGVSVDVPLGAAADGGAAAKAAGASPAGGTGATAVQGGDAAATGLASTLLLALIGGLILNLMPCVFPVLGIKILGFVNQAGHQRSRVAAHGLVFTLGVLASFWALAAVLGILRAGGDELGWGFQLQSPVFVYGLAVVMLVFGLNMSGVFEFGLSATAIGSDLQMKSGYSGSFFSGVLATVVATPCSAPFLAPALGAALAVSTAESFAIFTAIGIGLSLPYLLLSVFPQAVKVLPRPGAWMETFKQVMAFPLYATAAYLTWVLAAQTSEEGFRSVLFSFVLIAFAIWLYGRWSAPGATPARARRGLAALLLVGAFGVWVGWPRTQAAANSSAEAPAVVWEPWSNDTVEKLRKEGRIVYVDFTARWCATCQTNKRLVFHDDAVLRTFADRKIATLRADWTNRDPRITAELAKYGRSAVPFNLIWLPNRDQPVVLPELLTPSTVLNALK